MTPMMATYRRGASAIRGQATRSRAVPPAGGPMPPGQQGNALCALLSSLCCITDPPPQGMTGIPSPSAVGPPSSPSLTAPSTPTMPLTPTAMPSQSMGMAPPMNMQPSGTTASHHYAKKTIHSSAHSCLCHSRWDAHVANRDDGHVSPAHGYATPYAWLPSS